MRHETGSCLPEQDLAQFVTGDLDRDRIQAIALHVDDCASCQDTVVALAEESDTFVASLREAGNQIQEPADGALQLGLRRLLASARNQRPGTTSEVGPFPALRGAPQCIGPYVLRRQLASGGMGHVYEAVHSRLKRVVALKVLPADRWAQTSAVTRFQREMEAIGQLDHPHIVRASDAGEDGDMHYLVMEYVDGLDLSRLVQRLGPVPIPEACEIARQAAVGLEYAHQHGLVHRDVKPSNLMLAWECTKSIASAPQPTVKLLDLGLALLGEEHVQDGRDLTTVGTLMGTLDYMSPEQGVDSHAVDQRTDIYGLGATLFKLITGRAPYADPNYNTLIKKMTALATKPAPSIGTLCPELPPPLVAVVDKMLARDPDDRYASARDVAEALRPHVGEVHLDKLLRRGLATEERPANADLSVPMTARASDTSTRLIKARPSQNGMRSTFWGGLLLFCIAIVTLAGILFRLSTDYGELVIESMDPQTTIVLSQNDQPVEQLTVSHGKNSFRVRTGRYDVRVSGDAQLTVEPSQLDIRRGALASLHVDSESVARSFLPSISAAQQQALRDLQVAKSRLETLRSNFDQAAQESAIQKELVRQANAQFGGRLDRAELVGPVELEAKRFELRESKAKESLERAQLAYRAKIDEVAHTGELSQLQTLLQDELRQLNAEFLDTPPQVVSIQQQLAAIADAIQAQTAQMTPTSVPAASGNKDGDGILASLHEARSKQIETVSKWKAEVRELGRQMSRSEKEMSKSRATPTMAGQIARYEAELSDMTAQIELLKAAVAEESLAQAGLVQSQLDSYPKVKTLRWDVQQAEAQLARIETISAEGKDAKAYAEQAAKLARKRQELAQLRRDHYETAVKDVEGDGAQRARQLQLLQDQVQAKMRTLARMEQEAADKRAQLLADQDEEAGKRRLRFEFACAELERSIRLLSNLSDREEQFRREASRQLAQQRRDLELRDRELSMKYGPQHPKRRAIQARQQVLQSQQASSAGQDPALLDVLERDPRYYALALTARQLKAELEQVDATTLPGSKRQFQLQHELQDLNAEMQRMVEAVGQPIRRSPPTSDVIQLDSQLLVHVLGTAPERPIAGIFGLESSGSLHLGPGYGRVKVAGMKLQEAEAAIQRHLLTELNAASVMVTWPRPSRSEFTSGAFTKNSEPTYQAQTYDQWLHRIRFERDGDVLAENATALVFLGEKNPGEAARAILKATRNVGADQQAYGVAEAMAGLEPRSLVESMLKEFAEGNGRSRDFLVFLLSQVVAHGSEAKGDWSRIRRVVQQQAGALVQARLDNPADLDVERAAVEEYICLFITYLGYDESDPRVIELLSAVLDREINQTNVVHLAAMLEAMTIVAPDTPGLADQVLALYRWSDVQQANAPPQFRPRFAKMVQRLGPQAKPIVPDLIEMLDIALAGAAAGSLQSLLDPIIDPIIESLGSMGSSAHSAVDTLKKYAALADEYTELRPVGRRALLALKKIGEEEPASAVAR